MKIWIVLPVWLLCSIFGAALGVQASKAMAACDKEDWRPFGYPIVAFLLVVGPAGAGAWMLLGMIWWSIKLEARKK